MKKKILILGLAVFLLLGGSVEAKEYSISDYDISLQLKETGNYLITERISYNFERGSFTEGYRSISQAGFDEIKFISLKAVNTDIKDYQISKNGDKLDLKWYYPPASEQATFIIKYLAVGGLRSSDGRNIINWTPIKDEWEVPIKDIDIKFNLPAQAENIQVKPQAEIKNTADGKIVFQRASLPPRTNYSLQVSFSKIISAPELLEIKFIYILAALGVGFIYAGLDFFVEQRKTGGEVDFSGNVMDFSGPELSGILVPNSQQERVGLAAEVFSLAQQGKLKLISNVREKFFGGKQAEVKVHILAEENLTDLQKLLVAYLKEKETFKKFLQSPRIFKEVSELAEEKLLDQGLLDHQQLIRKKRLLIWGLVLLFGGISLAVIGILTRLFANLAVASGLFLAVIGLGKLFKREAVTLLTPAGVGIQTEIKEVINKKQQLLKQKVAENPRNGLEFFLAELPLIILDPEFDRNQLSKYKEQFKQIDEFTIPDWIEFDLSDLDITLDELEVTELIDQMVASTIYIAAASGAVGGGAVGGAGGSGGGGVA